MGTFAKISDENIVQELITIPDEFDASGESYIANMLFLDGKWKYSHTGDVPARGSFAAIGGEYLEDVDKFVPLKPTEYPSFIFDTDAWQWVAPVPKPKGAYWLANVEESPIPIEVEMSEDGTSGIVKLPVIPATKKVYLWDEDNTSWVRTHGFEPKSVPEVDRDAALSEFKKAQNVSFPDYFVENEQGIMVPPVPYPDDGKYYMWSIADRAFVETEPPTNVEPRLPKI